MLDAGAGTEPGRAIGDSSGLNPPGARRGVGSGPNPPAGPAASFGIVRLPGIDDAGSFGTGRAFAGMDDISPGRVFERSAASPPVRSSCGGNGGSSAVALGA